MIRFCFYRLTATGEGDLEKKNVFFFFHGLYQFLLPYLHKVLEFNFYSLCIHCQCYCKYFIRLSPNDLQNSHHCHYDNKPFLICDWKLGYHTYKFSNMGNLSSIINLFFYAYNKSCKSGFILNNNLWIRAM